MIADASIPMTGCPRRVTAVAFGDFLSGSAGAFLVIGLIAAPWMYGATRHWAIIALCQCLSCMAGLWIIGLLFSQRQPAAPLPLLTAIFFLLLSGWGVVLTRPALPPDPEFAAHFAELYARWPGSFIVKTPVETMWLYTGLLAALLVAIDLSRRRFWQQSFAITIVATGASIVLLGFAQIRSGATAMLWDTRVPFVGYFFGTYFHRTIAGAFINLTWPVAAGLLLYALYCGAKMTPARIAEIALWGLLTAIGVSGIFAQLCRFAQANVGFLLIALIGWLIWRFPARRTPYIGAGILLICLLASIACVVNFSPSTADSIKARWKSSFVPAAPPPPPQTSLQSPRMRADLFMESDNPIASQFMGTERMADATCLRMIPAAGLFGFGPGTWSRTYFHFTTDPLLRTFFLYTQFAHQDYLQTIVEWGLLGAAAWGLILFGGLRSGFARLRRFRREGAGMTREEGIVLGALASLIGVLLHSMIDFPLQIPSIQLYACVLLALLWQRNPPALADQ
jgi:hypothetical protein